MSTQAGSSATATATIGYSSRQDGIHTDDDPRLPTTRLYRRQITAFDPSDPFTGAIQMIQGKVLDTGATGATSYRRKAA